MRFFNCSQIFSTSSEAYFYFGWSVILLSNYNDLTSDDHYVLVPPTIISDRIYKISSSTTPTTSSNRAVSHSQAFLAESASSCAKTTITPSSKVLHKQIIIPKDADEYFKKLVRQKWVMPNRNGNFRYSCARHFIRCVAAFLYLSYHSLKKKIKIPDVNASPYINITKIMLRYGRRAKHYNIFISSVPNFRGGIMGKVNNMKCSLNTYRLKIRALTNPIYAMLSQNMEGQNHG